MMGIASRAKDDNEIVSKSLGESDIQRFYAGKTLLVTGSTGYMGRSLIEKLLRSCPDVKRIYLLIREKKGKTAEQRINEYFDDMLFDTLRGMGTDFKSKIRMIEGDLMMDEIVSSNNDRDAVIEEVNLIFHLGSNVKFMERLSTALKNNVMGTQAVIDLANQCKRIEGFMYVSTIFSHCYRKDIMEVAYPPPGGIKLTKDLIAADLASPTGLTGSELSGILGDFPNAYIFTKAIAEGLVDDAAKQAPFPCIMYRPSIVMPSWKEPVSGWCGNLNGPNFIFAGYTLGIVHAGIVGDNNLDVIPVDMATNSMLVTMWDAVKDRPCESRSLIYNYGSSIVNPTSIKRGITLSELPDGKNPVPSIHTVWKPFLYCTTSTWRFVILHIFFHFLPAVIFDLYLLVNGKKTRALSALKTIIKSHSILSYFSLKEWRMDITEMSKAIDRMNATDYELFFCDIKELDWQRYFSTYWYGIRVYGLKDPITTLPAAQRKVRILTAMHYIGKYAILSLIAYATLRFFGLL